MAYPTAFQGSSVPAYLVAPRSSKTGIPILVWNSQEALALQQRLGVAYTTIEVVEARLPVPMPFLVTLEEPLADDGVTLCRSIAVQADLYAGQMDLFLAQLRRAQAILEGVPAEHSAMGALGALMAESVHASETIFGNMYQQIAEALHKALLRERGPAHTAS